GFNGRRGVLGAPIHAAPAVGLLAHGTSIVIAPSMPGTVNWNGWSLDADGRAGLTTRNCSPPLPTAWVQYCTARVTGGVAFGAGHRGVGVGVNDLAAEVGDEPEFALVEVLEADERVERSWELHGRQRLGDTHPLGAELPVLEHDHRREAGLGGNEPRRVLVGLGLVRTTRAGLVRRHFMWLDGAGTGHCSGHAAPDEAHSAEGAEHDDQ